MKRTEDGSWAHVACAIWINEVMIGNPLFMEPIERISDIPKSRWSMTCYICKTKKGACVQCYHKQCFRPFHVTCAQKSGLTLRITQKGNETHKRAFCHVHTPVSYHTLMQPGVKQDSQAKSQISSRKPQNLRRMTTLTRGHLIYNLQRMTPKRFAMIPKIQSSLLV